MRLYSWHLGSVVSHISVEVWVGAEDPIVAEESSLTVGAESVAQCY